MRSRFVTLALSVVAVGTGAGLAPVTGGSGGPPDAQATGPIRLSSESPFASCPTKPSFVNAEVEPAIASDPRHPNRLVAIYQQDRYHSGGARGIVIALSENGGREWRRLSLPVSRCAGPRARQAPFASDPWVSVGPDGRIYASTLSDVVSVTSSADWGRSWSKPAILRGSGLNDKPTVTADPRRAGTAYAVWSDYRRTTPPGTESDELVAVTHDRGRSWSPPRLALRYGKRAGPEDGQILVDPTTARLYLLMAWVRDGLATPAEPAWMLIASSSDGGLHWSKARRFAVGQPAARSGPTIRSSPQLPSFAIDARGVLYAAWQDARFHAGNREDIVLTSSADGGVHWSPVRRISAKSSAAAIIPTIAARGNGVLGVIYLQLQRGREINGRYHVAISTDGGRQFSDRIVSPSFAVTDAPELTPSPLVPGGYFLGDYMGITSGRRHRFATAFVMANGAVEDKTDVYFAWSS
jgi:photosystem II stability/assembly factor-like uncharacterized protein